LGDAAPPLEGGRYRLIDVLGEGGMAVVYRAWDNRLEVWRAIKVLNAQLTNRTTIRTRFENEARTMAKLHHRNIVTVHDVGRDQQRVYMVMEMVEGGSLVDWVEEHGPMPPRMAIDVMKEVLVALQVAHDNSVIHRDIKPHNILIARDGTPKVSDFGIARLADTDHSFTKTGAMMGTWTYMAPEQRTSARRVDGRADVYAAAATLYALVTAKEPFDLYTTELHDELFAGIPVDIAEVIKTGTRYRPEDRFPSADAFREALGTLDGEYPVIPAGTPALVVHALSRGASAPPPPPLEEEEELAAQSDPTFFLGETRAGTLGAGALQEVAPEVSKASAVAEPSLPSDGTLSEDEDSDVVSLPAPTLRRGDTGLSEEAAPRGGGWTPWVLVALLSLALVVGVVVAGGLGVALFAGDRVFGGAEDLSPVPADEGTEVAPPEEVPAAPVVPEEASEPPVEAAEPTASAGEEGAEEAAGTAEATPPAAAAAPEPRPRPTPAPVAPAPAPRVEPPPPTTEPAPEPKRTIVVRPAAEPEPEAEPEPAPAALVELRVNSVPYYSQLYIDGSHVGRTPFTGQVPAGSHGLVLEGTKGGRKEMTVDLVAGQSKLLCWDFNAGAECQRR